MNKVSIVILTYNNLVYNRLCIESIRCLTPEESYELIVVDNHSEDGTAEWLSRQSGLTLIRNERNMGFPAGCNQGIRAAEAGNDILLLNNDTVVTPGWLGLLQACLYSGPDVGAVGPVTNACSNFQQIAADYRGVEGLERFAQSFNRSDPARWEERVRLIGFCLLIRREALDRIGPLDERFGMGNYEDDDYSLRIRLAGYRLLLCGDCFIHHFGSGSFGKDAGAFRERLEENRRRFAEKWGFDPVKLAVDERLILEPWLEKLAPPRSVLVLNSMFGAVPFYLKKRYPDANVRSVEENPFCRLTQPGSLKGAGSAAELGEARFDLVVFLSGGWKNAVVPEEPLESLVGKNGALLLLGDTALLGAFLSARFPKFRRSAGGGVLLLESPRPSPSAE